MIIGECIIAATDTLQETYTVYYSPWFPRGGNAATFVCEVIATTNIAEFLIDVQTKNSEQSDNEQDTFSPANGASNSITLTSNTATKFTVGAALNSTASNGILELVRFRYQIIADEGFSGRGFAHFRMLNPSWLTN